MKYPFTPLAVAMGMTEAAAAGALGISGSTEQEYRRDGMSELVAERRAVQVGLVPYDVWPEMLEVSIGDLFVECAAPDCTERFDPQAWSTKRRRYCSRTCQQRTNARRRYQEDPATRERRKAFTRRYKAEVRAMLERRAA